MSTSTRTCSLNIEYVLLACNIYAIRLRITLPPLQFELFLHSADFHLSLSLKGMSAANVVQRICLLLIIFYRCLFSVIWAAQWFAAFGWQLGAVNA